MTATTKTRLHVSRLSVRGVLGIEESVIDLDNITVLKGRNGSTKSSHVDALRAILGVDRTSLVTIAHREEGKAFDKPEGEALLVSDDGGRQVRVRRRGTGSPEVREYDGTDWRPVPRPVEWLHEVIDVRGANPAALLALKPEDLAAAIIEAMPLPSYDRAEALRLAGLPDFRLPAIPEGLHPLEDLELVEKAVFDARTGVNAEERREKDAASKLLQGLPADPPADVAADLEAADAQAQQLAAEVTRREALVDEAEREKLHTAGMTRDAAVLEVRNAFKAEAAKMRADHAERAAEIRAEAEKRIAELKDEMEVALDDKATKGGDQVADLERQHDNEADTIRAASSTARQEIAALAEQLAHGRANVATLRERQNAIATDRHVRRAADAAKDSAERFAARSRQLTAALEALKRYKVELAGTLPIPGLAVTFDEKGKKTVTLDDVPLDQVNKARRAEVAVQISLLRAEPPADESDRPYLPIIFLDDAEKLDDEARAALFREVAARGAQVIAAVVSRQPLEVLRGEAALA